MSRTGISTLLATLVPLWLLLSGYFTPLILTLGLVSVLLVLWLSIRLDLLPDRSVPGIVLRLPPYLFWLSWQVIVSNLQVAAIVLRPANMRRSVIHTTALQRTPLGVAIYANSITLTPGTITLDAEDGYLTVHALAPQCADDVTTDVMNKRVTAVEGNL